MLTKMNKTEILLQMVIIIKELELVQEDSITASELRQEYDNLNEKLKDIILVEILEPID